MAMSTSTVIWLVSWPINFSSPKMSAVKCFPAEVHAYSTIVLVGRKHIFLRQVYLNHLGAPFL